MKKLRRKKSIHILLSVFAVVLLLYFIYTISVCATINGVIKKALNDESYDSSLSRIVGRDDYEIINPRQPELEEGLSVKTEASNSFPLVLPFITNARYTYSYTATDVNTDEVIYGALSAHVTVKLNYSAFPCYIEEVEEAP